MAAPREAAGGAGLVGGAVAGPGLLPPPANDSQGWGWPGAQLYHAPARGARDAGLGELEPVLRVEGARCLSPGREAFRAGQLGAEVFSHSRSISRHIYYDDPVGIVNGRHPRHESSRVASPRYCR